MPSVTTMMLMLGLQAIVWPGDALMARNRGAFGLNATRPAAPNG
jgi:hypothetical protein